MQPINHLFLISRTLLSALYIAFISDYLISLRHKPNNLFSQNIFQLQKLRPIDLIFIITKYFSLFVQTKWPFKTTGMISWAT